MSMKNILAIFLSLFFLSACQKQNEDWSSYGKDLTNQRFSKSDQINTKNVNNLELAELGTIELKLSNYGKKDPIFGKMPDIFCCQMGHEDIVIKQPKNSIILASSEKIEIEAFCFKGKPIYCTQFHPELSGKNGLIFLKNFCNYSFNL